MVTKYPHRLNPKVLVWDFFAIFSKVRCAEFNAQRCSCQLYVIVATDSQNLGSLNRGGPSIIIFVC